MSEALAERQLDHKVASALWTKYSLDLSGFGGGHDPDNPGKCGRLNYCFAIQRQLTLEEARTLLIDVMRDTLEIVNQSEYAKQHMSTYPCTVNNVWICIAMRNVDGSYPEPPLIRTMDLGSKGAVYRTVAPELEYGYTDVIKESYQEAVQHVRQKEGE